MSHGVCIIKYEQIKTITTIDVNMRLKNKYQLGNDKYLLHISSTNWHKKKLIHSAKRLKLFFIDRIIIAKIEGVTDQMII